MSRKTDEARVLAALAGCEQCQCEHSNYVNEQTIVELFSVNHCLDCGHAWSQRGIA